MNVLNFFRNTKKQRPRMLMCVCVYASSIIFRFRKRTFWRENISVLECNKEIHLPLSLLKIPAMETPVTFCRLQAAMLLLCYIPRYQSFESLFWVVVFASAIRILWETAEKRWRLATLSGSQRGGPWSPGALDFLLWSPEPDHFSAWSPDRFLLWSPESWK